MTQREVIETINVLTRLIESQEAYIVTTELREAAEKKISELIPMIETTLSRMKQCN